MNKEVRISAHAHELRLVHPWRIAGTSGSITHQTVIVELTNDDGVVALGEAAPAAAYGESVAGVLAALARMDPAMLVFEDVAGSMAGLADIPGLPIAARCALNLALLDGAARIHGQALHDYLGLGFREGRHVTSFSIGIDLPEIIRKKVLAAAAFPVLKLKLGDPRDMENFAALREAAPDKPVRLDANEGWKTREEALRMIEWLMATDPNIQFIEQPMPRHASPRDMRWLKERSPLPVFADESCHTVNNIALCAECFHGVNVKLIKAGGVSMAMETLAAARQAGLKTMIGCMIETSVQISAAAHLAELADYLDLDGSLLIANDPYTGVTAEQGVLSFAGAGEKFGLQVRPRVSTMAQDAAFTFVHHTTAYTPPGASTRGG